MNINDRHIIYFLGIGGIGMSALARWFMHTGCQVSGYDKTTTPLTQKLTDEGASIHYQDELSNIPAEVLNNKDKTLVIYTPAIPADLQEYNYLLKKKYTIIKRSAALGLLTKNMFAVAVAGTHGKTTTSSMIAHILNVAGKSSVAFLGGILQGYESNLLIEGDPTPETIAALEADEYDRSFLQLSPNIAVVTSADADHLDIYKSHHDLKLSFIDFVKKIENNGSLYANTSIISWISGHNLKAKTHSYGLSQGENKAANVRISGSNFMFDYIGANHHIDDISLPVPGYHNVENAIAAVSVASQLGVTDDTIKTALSTFKGVKRRFEYHINTGNLVYIDDYAHHPMEIKAFLSSVKALYPKKKITAVFQPHLFSRTKDFADGLAQSLDMADEVFMLNIYPARELPIEGVSAEMILQKMQSPHKSLVPDDKLLDTIAARHPEILLTIGAGNIDRFVLPIKQLLENEA